MPSLSATAARSLRAGRKFLRGLVDTGHPLEDLLAAVATALSWDTASVWLFEGEQRMSLATEAAKLGMWMWDVLPCPPAPGQVGSGAGRRR